MAEKTSNYNLIKPSYADEGDIKDINDNMDSIDAILLDHSTGLIQHTSQLASLENGKINKPSGVAAGKYLQTDANGEETWGDAASPQVIISATEGWLTQHINTNEFGVDDTLLIAGDAADSKVTGEAINTVMSAVQTEATARTNADNDIKSAITYFEDTGNIKNLIGNSESLGKNYYWTGTTGNTLTKSNYNSDSIYTEAPIDIRDFIGGYILIQLNHTNMSGSRCTGFCNSSNVIRHVWKENGFVFTYNSETGYYERSMYLDPTCEFFFFSYSKSVATEIIITAYKKKMYTKEETDAMVGNVLFVATNGSDSNSGTSTNPLATVNRALELGGSRIAIFGGTYAQDIDLSKSQKKEVIIFPYTLDDRVVFRDPSAVIGTSASNVSGYTYVKSISSVSSIDSANRWAYQEGIADAKSLISDSARHPLQRGQEYKRYDTRIIKCSSSSLSDALSEIETNAGNGTYKWFYDSTNSVFYFASPSSVSNSNPICMPKGNALLKNRTREISFKATGIVSKYYTFNVSDMHDVVLTDCKAENIFDAGAFMYNDVVNVQFIRCEASTCVNGENGDGFNGHATLTNAVFAKQCTALLVDCWSHDNNDDGYSDHERAETMIIGGLFENNNKGGIVPSYGSHCTCYNVMARGNYSGFLCTGTAEQSEGGKYTQLICYNCIAIDNARGGKFSGFCVNGENNKMICYNCESISNKYGYTAELASNSMQLYDCKAYGNSESVKYGSGTFTIINGQNVD